jgi:hypothetical protein
LPRQQQVGDQQAQDRGRGQGWQASRQHRQMPLKQAVQIEAVQEHGKRTSKSI